MQAGLRNASKGTVGAFSTFRPKGVDKGVADQTTSTWAASLVLADTTDGGWGL